MVAFIRLVSSCIIIFVLSVTNCAAASLEISPVRLSINPNNNTSSSFTTTNQDEGPVLLQVQIKKWSQENGEDIYTDTQELIVKPAIFKLEPKETQVLRVAMRAKQNPANEYHYRIFVKEVRSTTILEDERTSKPQSALSMVMQVAIPVFFLPQEPSPHVDFVLKQEKNKMALQVGNTGNIHVRIKDIAIVDTKTNKSLYQNKYLEYVLPDSKKELPIPLANKPVNPIKIVLDTDQGVFEKIQNG